MGFRVTAAAVGARASSTSSFGYRATAEEVTQGLDLTGKTALVTGCNAGIGYETMRALAMRGAHVYGLARDLGKAERACASVNVVGVPGMATAFACEQTSFDSVRACAEVMLGLNTAIDMMICNAGVYLLPTLELANGIEKHFVVNHLSHFILVDQLLDLVKSAEQGRVVVVGSDAYKFAPAAGIEFDNLAGQRYYDPAKMYGQSKLANGLFVRELARRLDGTRVTSNVVHPGWVVTETMHRLIGSRNIDPQKVEHAKMPKEGAATPCYVATNTALAAISGEYFEDCAVVVPGGHMRDATMAKKLWDVSSELTSAYLNNHG